VQFAAVKWDHLNIAFNIVETLAAECLHQRFGHGTEGGKHLNFGKNL
jgi:hypothetical protein